MTHLLDTNTCIMYLRQTSAGTHVATRLANAVPGSVVLCSVVVAELLFGAYRSNQVVKNLQQTTAFCARFDRTRSMTLPPMSMVAFAQTWRRKEPLSGQMTR